MEIKKEQLGDMLIFHLSGRLDASNAPKLDKELTSSLNDVVTLIFDCAKLDYIASAGLRSLLMAQKRMNKQGSMKLRHVSAEVKEVLDMTGFADFLTIE